jgi:hypothetical protein
MATLGSAPKLCGQLVIRLRRRGLDARYRAALAAGRRDGAILFRRNVRIEARRRSASIREAAGDELPPSSASIRRAGGRVAAAVPHRPR